MLRSKCSTGISRESILELEGYGSILECGRRSLLVHKGDFFLVSETKTGYYIVKQYQTKQNSSGCLINDMFMIRIRRSAAGLVLVNFISPG